jgi:peptidoglycan/LPS O-acetylase OafA/YrhL
MFFGTPEVFTGKLIAFLAVMAGFLVLTLWSTWHAMHRQFESTNEKIFWVQLTILVPVLGGIAYALWGRKRGQPS